MNPPELDIGIINAALHERYFNYPGDFGAGRPNKLSLEFHHITEWRDYLFSLQIRSAKVPAIHADAYHVALRMLLLGWVEPAVIKSAEMQAMRSLEAALVGVYFQCVFEREQAKHDKARQRCGICKKCMLCAALVREKFRPGLGVFLDYMAAHDDLDPELHNESKKATGNALNFIRNGLAHGDPFNGLPWGGLMEAVRDVMEHAHRNLPDLSMSYVDTPDVETQTGHPTTGLF